MNMKVMNFFGLGKISQNLEIKTKLEWINTVIWNLEEILG